MDDSNRHYAIEGSSALKAEHIAAKQPSECIIVFPGPLESMSEGFPQPSLSDDREHCRIRSLSESTLYREFKDGSIRGLSFGAVSLPKAILFGVAALSISLAAIFTGM